MIKPLEQAQQILRTAGWDGTSPALVVLGAAQRLYALGGAFPEEGWPVSTGAAGFGNQQDSGCTPTGLHRVCACIGRDQPLGTAFKCREPTGEIIPDNQQPGMDSITSRILWLQGLEEGVNLGFGVDSKARTIYIHGTPHSHRLGSPVSAGCVRMDNQHIAKLFDHIPEGTLVLIVPP